MPYKVFIKYKSSVQAIRSYVYMDIVNTWEQAMITRQIVILRLMNTHFIVSAVIFELQ